MEFSVGEYMCGVPDSLNITGGKSYSATLDNVSSPLFFKCTTLASIESPVKGERWTLM